MPEDPNIEETQDVIEATAEDVEISDPDSPSTRARRWRWRWPIIALAVVLVLIAAAVAVAFIKPDLVLRALGTTGPASAEQLAALDRANKKTASELASLRTRVIALAGQVETQGNTDALASRLGAVEKKVEGLASSPVPGQTGSAADAQARARIIALTERLDALEAIRAAAPEPAESTADQRASDEQIKALQAALAARDRQLAALRGDNERMVRSIGGLAERLVRLEQAGPASGGGETAALVLAAGQLREALSRPGPFTEPLSALRALAEGDAVVARTVSTLEPLAAKGVVTRQMLADRFDAMARKVIQASVASENPGWVDKALARLAGVVTVRPTGENVEGNSAPAVLARAEARIKSDDLAAAVKELETLSGAAATAAASWLSDARTRLEADRAAAALSRHAIGRMAGIAPEAAKPAAE